MKVRKSLRNQIVGGLLAVFFIAPILSQSIATQSLPPGWLDLSFGNGGIVTTFIYDIGHYYGPSAILVQPDGKILVSGQIDSYGPFVSFFIARYDPTGTLDASFGVNGMIMAPIDPDGEFVGADIALQPDGKIIAVGYQTYNSINELSVHRYNSNGPLDTSFGFGGRAVTTIENLSDVNSVALQPEGKIVVVGNRWNVGDFVVVRHNTDGSLDNSFGVGGIVTTAIGSHAEVYEVLAQPDGKIVAVGTSRLESPQNSDWDFAIVRYNPDGSLDNSFGTGGIVITSIHSRDYAQAAILQPDGKIVAAGSTYPQPTTIVRYNPNGSIDTSFAENGIFTTERIFLNIHSIALQPDGKMVAFGSGQVPGSPVSGFAVVRLDPNGSLDANFGTNGRAITPIGAESTWASDGAIQSNGKILALGTATNYFSYEIAIVRYHGDFAVLPPTPFDFDGDGKTDIGIFRPAAGEWWINRSSNGSTFALQFGASTDRITPGDYTGDGKTDIAFFRPSTGFWFVLRSEDFSFYSFPFGANGDVPVPADFDADGRADAAVFRPSTLNWFILKSTGGTDITTFGAPGDKPVVADYDGDSKADIAIFRPSVGEWWVRRSSNQTVFALQFGSSTDKTVQGDYTGDGKADIAFWQPSTGFWFILRSEDFSFYSFPFGGGSDIPVPGDYDGDGRFDAGVFRPLDLNWYVLRSTGGTLIQQFGAPGDLPVPNAFVP